MPEQLPSVFATQEVSEALADLIPAIQKAVSDAALNGDFESAGQLVTIAHSVEALQQDIVTWNIDWQRNAAQLSDLLTVQDAVPTQATTVASETPTDTLPPQEYLAPIIDTLGGSPQPVKQADLVRCVGILKKGQMKPDDLQTRDGQPAWAHSVIAELDQLVSIGLITQCRNHTWSLTEHGHRAYEQRQKDQPIAQPPSPPAVTAATRTSKTASTGLSANDYQQAVLQVAASAGAGRPVTVAAILSGVEKLLSARFSAADLTEVRKGTTNWQERVWQEANALVNEGLLTNAGLTKWKISSEGRARIAGADHPKALASENIKAAPQTPSSPAATVTRSSGSRSQSKVNHRETPPAVIKETTTPPQAEEHAAPFDEAACRECLRQSILKQLGGSRFGIRESFVRGNAIAHAQDAGSAPDAATLKSLFGNVVGQLVDEGLISYADRDALKLVRQKPTAAKAPHSGEKQDTPKPRPSVEIVSEQAVPKTPPAIIKEPTTPPQAEKNVAPFDEAACRESLRQSIMKQLGGSRFGIRESFVRGNAIAHAQDAGSAPEPDTLKTLFTDIVRQLVDEGLVVSDDCGVLRLARSETETNTSDDPMPRQQPSPAPATALNRTTLETAIIRELLGDDGCSKELLHDDLEQAVASRLGVAFSSPDTLSSVLSSLTRRGIVKKSAAKLALTGRGITLARSSADPPPQPPEHHVESGTLTRTLLQVLADSANGMSRHQLVARCSTKLGDQLSAADRAPDVSGQPYWHTLLTAQLKTFTSRGIIAENQQGNWHLTVEGRGYVWRIYQIEGNKRG